MVHPQHSWAESLDQVLAVMRKGDVMTHMYHGMPHGILDDDGKIRPAVRAARDRGVIFDVGHGEGSFEWAICETALAQEFPPTTISSDLHNYNVNGPVFDLVTTISKFLMLGLRSMTRWRKSPRSRPGSSGWKARSARSRPAPRATPSCSTCRKAKFEFVDSRRVDRIGNLRLVPTAVVKAGRSIQPCSNASAQQ